MSSIVPGLRSTRMVKPKMCRGGTEAFIDANGNLACCEGSVAPNSGFCDPRGPPKYPDKIPNINPDTLENEGVTKLLKPHKTPKAGQHAIPKCDPEIGGPGCYDTNQGRELGQTMNV